MAIREGLDPARASQQQNTPASSQCPPHAPPEPSRASVQLCHAASTNLCCGGPSALGWACPFSWCRGPCGPRQLGMTFACAKSADSEQLCGSKLLQESSRTRRLHRCMRNACMMRVHVHLQASEDRLRRSNLSTTACIMLPEHLAADGQSMTCSKRALTGPRPLFLLLQTAHRLHRLCPVWHPPASSCPPKSSPPCACSPVKFQEVSHTFVSKRRVSDGMHFDAPRPHAFLSRQQLKKPVQLPSTCHSAGQPHAS